MRPRIVHRFAVRSFAASCRPALPVIAPASVPGPPVAPRWMSPAMRTVWPVSSPTPDTLDRGARGLCRPHLLYSAHATLPGGPREGPLRPVRKARERTPGECGRLHRRAGPSRSGDGETADDVPSLLHHTAGSCAEPPGACALPIDLRRPPRHSRPSRATALAGTRPTPGRSDSEATRERHEPPRGALPHHRNLHARNGGRLHRHRSSYGRSGHRLHGVRETGTLIARAPLSA